MTTQPRDADIELLSAYIDGEISAAERAALERRLDQEPLLQATLDELRATVGLLRELPRQEPPRSFTIDPATVRRPPAWAALAGWMRLGSALAALLLALTVTFEFVGGRGVSNAPMPPPSAYQQAPESAGGAPLPTMAALEAPLLAPEAMPEPTAAMDAQSQEAAPADSASNLTPDVATLLEATEPAPPIAGAPAPPAGEIIEDTQKSSPDTEDLASEPFERTAPALTPPAPQPPPNPLRLVQYGLAALVLLLSLGSWLAYRQRR